MGRGLVAAILAALSVLAMLALGAGRADAAPRAETQALAGTTAVIVDPLQEELAIDALSASTDPSVKHIGPVPSGSPDGGTCGNDWAEDTFDRWFTIRPAGDRTFTVYEQFKNGTFVTNAGPSPGACEETDGSSPGVVAGGVLGTMHGYILTTVVCDPTVPICPIPTATCAGSNCQSTNDFIATFFGPLATRNDEAYFFHYAGYDGSNQALVYHEWKNASCNRGGDHGDIATAAALAPFPPSALCL